MIGTVLVMLIAVVALVVALFWAGPGRSDLSNLDLVPTAAAPGSWPTTAGQAAAPDLRGWQNSRTAQMAYGVAQAKARQWQADATLLMVTGTADAGDSARPSAISTWGYLYYSPAARSAVAISVVENRAALVTQGVPAGPLAPLDASGWRIDSPAAVEKLLAAGGAEFIGQEESATLFMTLTTNNESGRIEWFLSLINNQSGRSFTVRLDASTGEILEVGA
ncbi:MAG: hypothetical protein AB1791_10410 [Chloroflexota bacterium]